MPFSLKISKSFTNRLLTDNETKRKNYIELYQLKR